MEHLIEDTILGANPTYVTSTMPYELPESQEIDIEYIWVSLI